MEGPYPGERLNDRERAALARDNERITRETMNRAHEQTLNDRMRGEGNPVIDAGKEIARKIERGEMESR